MKTKIWSLTSFIALLISLSMTISLPLEARKMGPSIITLKSCNIEISADKITYFNDTISYSGNVQFLYGLANVKTNSLLLVKNRDGSCQLIADQQNRKDIR